MRSTAPDPPRSGGALRFALALLAAGLVYAVCFRVAEVDLGKLWAGLPRLLAWAARAWPPDLTDLGALYGLARVTTESMELSTSLAPLDTMVAMARVLADMPTENIVFVQFPGETVLDGDLAGRVVPLEDAADALLERIRNDERFLPDEPEQGTVADPNAPAPAPSASGEATAEPAPTESASIDPSAAPSGSPSAAPTPEVLENVPGQTAADRRCSAAND